VLITKPRVFSNVKIKTPGIEKKNTFSRDTIRSQATGKSFCPEEPQKLI